MAEKKDYSKAPYEVGKGKPPKNRQFGQPGGNTPHRGAWKKENTPRYWLECMMKMDEGELETIYNDEAQPFFRRKLAKCIKDGEWKEIKEMIQEVYGKMPETQITVPADEETTEEANKIIRGFCLP